jgi:glucokinase
VSANRVIGVDLGGTKIAAGIVDRAGRIEAKREVATPTESEEAVVAAIERTVEGLFSVCPRPSTRRPAARCRR